MALKKLLDLILFLFVFFFSFILLERSAQASCFSFIPYGYNGEFSHLPYNENFCYFFGRHQVYVSTDLDGGRKITHMGDREYLLFGESQLLGMDWSEEEPRKKHDLMQILKKGRITAFAAPNNGPLQALKQFNYISKKQNIANKHVFFGFNYGTDIFRIEPTWDPRNFIPIQSSDLRKIFKIPFYHDVLLALARISGKYFGSSDSNSQEILREYFSLSFDNRLIHIRSWLEELNNATKNLVHVEGAILYPPYWYIGATEIQKKEIQSNYELFSCYLLKSKLFKKVYVAKLIEDKAKLAYDHRHFVSGSSEFNRLKTC